MGYQYRGEIRDTKRPNLQPCGTYPGYRRHIDHGEEACDECKAAMAAESRARRNRNHNNPAHPSQFTAEKCGTWP